MPSIDTATVYRVIADTLPEEGRDFDLKIATLGDGSQSLLIEPLTPMGEAWVPFLRDRLEHPMREKGMGLEIFNPGERVTEQLVKLQSRIADQAKTNVGQL